LCNAKTIVFGTDIFHKTTFWQKTVLKTSFL